MTTAERFLYISPEDKAILDALMQSLKYTLNIPNGSANKVV